MARQKKNIIILYNSTRYENEWLPSYMSDYKNVAKASRVRSHEIPIKKIKWD